MSTTRYSLTSVALLLTGLATICFGAFHSVATASEYGVSPTTAKMDKWYGNDKKIEQLVKKDVKQLERRIVRLEKVRDNIAKSRMNSERKTYMLARYDALIAAAKLRLGALTGSGSDVTPPATKAISITLKANNTAKLSVNLNEGGRGYYVVIASGSGAPSAAQVKDGQNGSGSLASIRGSGATVSGLNAFTISGLVSGTGYTAYFVAEDSYRNLQSSVSSASFVTAPISDTTPPVISAVTFSGATSTGSSLNFTSNETGTGYYVVLSGNSLAPTAAQVKLGQDGSGTTASIRGSASTTAGSNAFPIAGLTASSTYIVYFIVVDASGNSETSVHALVLSTTS